MRPPSLPRPSALPLAMHPEAVDRRRRRDGPPPRPPITCPRTGCINAAIRPPLRRFKWDLASPRSLPESSRVRLWLQPARGTWQLIAASGRTWLDAGRSAITPIERGVAQVGRAGVLGAGHLVGTSAAHGTAHVGLAMPRPRIPPGRLALPGRWGARCCLLRAGPTRRPLRFGPDSLACPPSVISRSTISTMPSHPRREPLAPTIHQPAAGGQDAVVRIDHVYDGYDVLPHATGGSFGAASGSPAASRQDRRSGSRGRTNLLLGTSPGGAVAGWSRHEHHVRDPLSRGLSRWANRHPASVAGHDTARHARVLPVRHLDNPATQARRGRSLFCMPIWGPVPVPIDTIGAGPRDARPKPRRNRRKTLQAHRATNEEEIKAEWRMRRPERGIGCGEFVKILNKGSSFRTGPTL